MQTLGDGRYDSVASFVKAARVELVNKSNRETRDSFVNGDGHGMGEHWLGAGCPDGKTVQQKLLSGWAEGQKRASTLLSKLDTSNLMPLTRKRRLVRDEQGDDIDMQQVYNGNLERAWTVAKRRRLYGPQQITICANMLCSGMDDSDTLFWRGAAAIAVTDKLEEAGYNIRLIVGFGNGTDKYPGSVSCRITVKDYGMPLDICTAASVIMPGFFRAIGHGWIAGHNKEKMESPGIAVGKCLIDPGEIFLSHEVRDKSTASKWIASQIDRINKEALGEAA